MFIGPRIIVIVENKRPTWCHLLFLFHFLCAQHVSDINISIIRSLRLFCWITTLVVLFLVRCLLEFRCGWVGVVSVLQASSSPPWKPHISQLNNWFRLHMLLPSSGTSMMEAEGYNEAFIHILQTARSHYPIRQPFKYCSVTVIAKFSGYIQNVLHKLCQSDYHCEYKILYQNISDCHLLRHCEHSNVSRYYRILYGVSPYEPPIRLLAPLLDSTPSSLSVDTWKVVHTAKWRSFWTAGSVT